MTTDDVLQSISELTGAKDVHVYKCQCDHACAYYRCLADGKSVSGKVARSPNAVAILSLRYVLASVVTDRNPLDEGFSLEDLFAMMPEAKAVLAARALGSAS